MNTDNGTTSWRDRSAVDLALLAIRIVVGVIFVAHGGQKMWGWFGGPGLQGMVGFLGVPLGYLVSIGEFFGGLGLLFGFLSRFSAASLIVIMIGAIVNVHGRNGFFLGAGPDTKMAEAGFEYCFALIGLLAPILIAGPGSVSITHLFLPKSRGTISPLIVLE